MTPALAAELEEGDRMEEQMWAVRLDWPKVTGGVNCRGEHDPAHSHSGLNISYHVGDDPQRVAANRKRVLASMGAEAWPVVCAEQVHGNHVAIVRPADFESLWPCPAGLCCLQTDGLVTQEARLVLNLTFGDCVPILLYCPQPLTVGLLHAGWRSTAAQIARTGIEVMCSLGVRASDIRAVIGPAICAQCYEVGPEVIAAVADLPGAAELLASAPTNRVDLPELNRLTLLDCGLREEAIAKSKLCTRCGEVPFFSYRASGPNTGLQGAFIAITED